MAISELEALMSISDYRLRKYLIELIEYKEIINKELNSGDISVKKEMDLREMTNIIDSNIQKVRMSGILDLS